MSDAEVITLPRDRPVVVLAGVLLDGRGGILERQAIRVEDERIVSISPAADGAGNAASIDARDAWVMPALIDTHAHIGAGRNRGRLSAAARQVDEAVELIEAALEYRQWLSRGVTTVRTAGDDPRDLPLAARVAMADGYLEGPRLIVHGRVLPDDADDTGVLKEARRAIGEGADAIVAGKCTPGRRRFSPPQLQVLADEAHRRGARIALSAGSTEEAIDSLAAGFDGIEGVPSGDVCRFVDALGSHAAFLVPLIPDRGRERDRQLGALRLALETNVRIGAASNWSLTSRRGLEHATADLAEAGATAERVLAAVTSDAAWVLGLEADTGSLQVGRIGEMLITDLDPLGEASRLGRPHALRAVIRVSDSLTS